MTASDRPTILLSGQHKIAAHHLQRLAIIYVRQSSLHQVKHHKGSQINQYQLSQRAEFLNWSKERIRIIDTDLGEC